MGVVYLAKQLSLNRNVAVKFLLSSHLQNVDLFRNEARTGAQLNHPNIAFVFGFGHSAGKHFIVHRFTRGLPPNQKHRTSLIDGAAAGADGDSVLRDGGPLYLARARRADL